MGSSLTHTRVGRGTTLGPDIRIVFRDIHKLIPLMRDDPAKSQYLDVLLALRKVNNGVFGLQLNPDWQHHLASLESAFSILTSSQGMPLTPKFHVIILYIKQSVEMNLCSLGMESEQSGESLHHVGRILY